ncbi:MAG: hypothetical protein E6600_10610 [Anaerocolumna aminovalerica]|uniref:hypothetical protein n=1 Tax=Anaerocolumna aminovalerica TaxID=1527 RepID=UPI002911F004|nr:hypothetical protein [Anaerocolumna aminovalerica]MDU6264940.1 hypothetical protein [Anaerocolumna aminovalerica]
MKSNPLNKLIPNITLNPIAENTLNLSGIPKNSCGTILVPIAPAIINNREIPAHKDKETYFLSQ